MVFLRSAPVQKARSPVPVITATRSSGSSRNSRSALFKAIIDSTSSALSDCGRFIRTTRVRPLRSVSMLTSANGSLSWEGLVGVLGDSEKFCAHITGVGAEQRRRRSQMAWRLRQSVRDAVVDAPSHHGVVECDPMLAVAKLNVVVEE